MQTLELKINRVGSFLFRHIPYEVWFRDRELGNLIKDSDGCFTISREKGVLKIRELGTKLAFHTVRIALPGRLPPLPCPRRSRMDVLPQMRRQTTINSKNLLFIMQTLFDENGNLNISDIVLNHPSYKKIMEDGIIVTDDELKEQADAHHPLPEKTHGDMQRRAADGHSRRHSRDERAFHRLSHQ